MKNVKKLFSIGLAGLLTFCVSASFVGCGPYQWEIRQQEVFEVADKIEKHPDYALCNKWEYRSAEKTIIWKDLIKEKIKDDGKNVEKEVCYTELYLNEPNKLEGAFVAFTYYYNNEFNWFGLNKNNVNYAIGTMSLDDFSFSIHYLDLPSSNFDIVKTSTTHFCCKLEDDDEIVYLLINRENGKIEEEWESMDLVKENFKDEISIIYNHTTYTENGITYTVNSRSIENEEENVRIDIPSYETVMEKSEELQQINEVAKADGYSVSSAFITNGTELFVVYGKESGKFGSKCDLIPVVFRCDTSLQTFEYVGCMYNAYMYYPSRLSVIRID